MNPTPKHIAKLLTYLGTLPWQPFDKDDWMVFNGCETEEPCIVYGEQPLKFILPVDWTSMQKLMHETGCDVVCIREVYDNEHDKDYAQQYGTVSYSMHFTNSEGDSDNMGCVWLNTNFRTGKCDHGIDIEGDIGPEFIGWVEKLQLPGWFPEFEKEHASFEADAPAPAQEWDCAELPAPLAR